MLMVAQLGASISFVVTYTQYVDLNIASAMTQYHPQNAGLAECVNIWPECCSEV